MYQNYEKILEIFNEEFCNTYDMNDLIKRLYDKGYVIVKSEEDKEQIRRSDTKTDTET